MTVVRCEGCGQRFPYGDELDACPICDSDIVEVEPEEQADTDEEEEEESEE